jgi:hypothetical protein
MRAALVTGPLGTRVTEAGAREQEAVLKSLPAELREPRRALAAGAPARAGARGETSWISTAAIDRHGDVVLPGGMDDRHFAANPVVTWNHDTAAPPAGLSAWRRVTARGVLARTVYPARPEELAPAVAWTPDVAWALVRSGLLVGKSIGFLATRTRAPTAEETRARPEMAGARQVVSGWILLEYACVFLPANPETLVLPEGAIRALGERTAEVAMKRLGGRAGEAGGGDGWRKG